jgi:hypothetical protein
VFAALKITASFVIACVSLVAAIVGSGHPLLFGCLCAAFIMGALGAEGLRVHRRKTVRSIVR